MESQLNWAFKPYSSVFCFVFFLNLHIGPHAPTAGVTQCRWRQASSWRVQFETVTAAGVKGGGDTLEKLVNPSASQKSVLRSTRLNRHQTHRWHTNERGWWPLVLFCCVLLLLLLLLNWAKSDDSTEAVQLNSCISLPCNKFQMSYEHYKKLNLRHVSACILCGVSTWSDCFRNKQPTNEPNKDSVLQQSLQ